MPERLVTRNSRTRSAGMRSSTSTLMRWFFGSLMNDAMSSGTASAMADGDAQMLTHPCGPALTAATSLAMRPLRIAPVARARDLPDDVGKVDSDRVGVYLYSRPPWHRYLIDR